jgi:hypothetical protein
LRENDHYRRIFTDGKHPRRRGFYPRHQFDLARSTDKDLVVIEGRFRDSEVRHGQAIVILDRGVALIVEGHRRMSIGPSRSRYSCFLRERRRSTSVRWRFPKRWVPNTLIRRLVSPVSAYCFRPNGIFRAHSGFGLRSDPPSRSDALKSLPMRGGGCFDDPHRSLPVPRR